jgi:hypothetical protein
MQIINPIESINNLRKCRVDDGVYKDEGEVDKVREDEKKQYALFKIIELITESKNNTITNKVDLMKNLKTITNNCNPIIDKIIASISKPSPGVVQSSPVVVQSSSVVDLPSFSYFNLKKKDEKQKEEYYELNIVLGRSTINAKYIDIFRNNDLLKKDFDGKKFRLFYDEHNFKEVSLNKTDETTFVIKDNVNDEILNDKDFYKMTSYGYSYGHGIEEREINYFKSICVNNKEVANEYNKQNGGVLSKNKGKKGVYKSTKQKVSVIIDKKHYNKTVYKNSKGVSYIRCNNEYKLLKKYKLSKL